MTTLFLIGRVLFGGFFLMSAYSHFKNAEGMSGYAKMKGVPSPKLAVLLSGFLFLAGGASVILGVRPILGLGLIVVTMVPITFMMHPFWSEKGDAASKNADRIQFMKNVAIIGASLMLLAALGPWPYSF